jgi:hypothetical protein
MKTKSLILSLVLTVVLTLPLFGQHHNDDTTKTDMKKHHLSKMMNNPKVDVNVEGLHMKVWVMTQRQHKKMMKQMKHERVEMKDTSMAMGNEMKGMKHDDMKMDKSMKEEMMKGTHHIMLNVTDVASGKEITEVSATVLIISPSKKNTSVDLKPMMNNCFGDGLALDEKGEYQFTVSVKVDGVSKTTQFQYLVK